MPRALFETPISSGVAQKPVGADGLPSWNGHNLATYQPSDPTAIVLFDVDAATYNDMKTGAQSGSFVWLGDASSPVRDEPVSAAKAGQIRQWFRDHGYSGARFGAFLSAIAAARRTRALVGAVAAL